ncbi:MULTISPECIES: hypothetical protein [unclassified Corallococcus]|uniref:hypothetical protein n=1 Tax=unclassified Corallococcus TaxID=2685029 RepID=UPI001A8C8FE8|nr:MULTISPECIES: hypothetical protein [unclassified Corallococcus]MBN9687146.1 hypothetical protein [Corallococcus sp. NCSPR001]WAS89027.1 hypothetical protein O0N60_19090 [Corallococcus sp. NCRR]
MPLCKMEKTLTCHCGTVFRSRHSRARWCSRSCTQKAKRQGIAKSYDPEDPGERYNVPLDGVDVEASERRREERIARVIAEGVPLAALRERFDCSEQVLRRVAELRGLTIHTGLPGGIPVLGA